MGIIDSIISAPDWDKKTPLEKANARADAFKQAIKSDSALLTEFNSADENKQREIYSAWKARVDEKYPKAFKTAGTVWSQSSAMKGAFNAEEVDAPVYDTKTEQVLEALNPANGREPYLKAKEMLKDDPEAQSQLDVLYASRYGNKAGIVPDKLTYTRRSIGRAERVLDIAKEAAPDAIRAIGTIVGGSLMGGGSVSAAPLTGGGSLTTLIPATTTGMVTGAAVAEPIAQAVEMKIGRRKKPSTGQALLNAGMAAIAPARLAGGPLTQTIARTVEGGALAGAYNAVDQALFDDNKFSVDRLNSSIATGTLAVAGLMGLGKLGKATLRALKGKTPQQIAADLPKIIEAAAPEEKEALEKLYQYTHQAPEIHPETGSTIPGYTQIDEIAGGQNVRSTNLDALRKEGINLPDVPEGMPSGQYTEQQIREAANKSSIDRAVSALPEERPNNAQIEYQARRMQEAYGFTPPSLAVHLGGATAGAAYGFATGDSPEDKLVRAAEFGALGAGSVNAVYNAAKWYSKPANRMAMHERIEDSIYRVKKLQEKVKGIIPDESNLEQKLRQMPGSLGQVMVKKNEFIDGLVNEYVEASKKTGVAVDNMRRDVNALLQATHATERNKILGDGAAGMTDAEAAIVIDAIQNSPHGREAANLAATLKQFHDGTLDVLRDGQLISDDFYKQLKQKYPNHVPLNRMLEEEIDIPSVLTSRSKQVRSSGILKAKGSELPVDDIAGNIIFNYEQAVIRAAKNKIGLTAKKMATENNGFNGLFTEEAPKIKGTTLDGAPIYDDKDPRFFSYFENGKRKFLKIDDPDLANAITGHNMIKLDGWAKLFGAYSRLMRTVATRAPSFIVTNAPRDLEEAMAYVAMHKDLGFGSAKNVASTWGQSVIDIFAHQGGQVTAGTKAYQELLDLGGTTGMMAVSSRENVKANLDKAFKIAQSKPRQALKGILESVDDLNEMFENATRLSIYKEALAKGISKDKAAMLAKEGTIDFNRMGTWGPVMNAVKVFTNASIQGSAKMLRVMKQNPKAAMGVFGTITGGVASVNAYNDQADPEWRTKVSKWDLQNSLPVVLPSFGGKNFNYIAIPVGWGLKPIKAFADGLYQVAMHGEDISKHAKNMVVATIEGYNPLGGSTLTQALTPTALQIPAQIATGTDWTGNAYKPERQNKYQSASEIYFPNLKDNAQGRLMIGATKYLSEKHGIEISPADINMVVNTLGGSILSDITRTGSTVKAAAKGEVPNPRDIPFVSKIVRSTSEEDIARRSESKAPEEYAETRTAQEKSTQQTKHRSDDLLKAWNQAEDKNAFIDSITDEDADLLSRALKKPTGESARVKSLDRKGGFRAKYIYDRIKNMSPDERAAYLDDIDDVLDDETAQELLDSLSGGQ